MIEIDQLLKYYGSSRAIGPVTTSVPDGQIVGLLGLNGAGKTTTLRMLAGDLLPTSGTIRIDGLSHAEAPEALRRRIGYLPDTPPLYPEMTVEGFLTFVARLRGVPRAQVASRVAEVLERTQLGGRRSQRIHELSHGYRQRVGIAQAIVHAPALVLLDEPISGLDPVQIVEMRGLLRSLRGEHTLIVSSHILSEISETCDRLLVLRDGQVVASGSEAELIASFLGRARVELLVQPNGPLQPLLTELQALSSVRSLTAQEQPEGPWLLHVEAEGELRAELARRVVAAGHGLLSLGRRQRELEALFLELSVTSPPAEVLS